MIMIFMLHEIRHRVDANLVINISLCLNVFPFLTDICTSLQIPYSEAPRLSFVLMSVLREYKELSLHQVCQCGTFILWCFRYVQKAKCH